MPHVLVHSIKVWFVDGSSLDIDPDHVERVRVFERRLEVEEERAPAVRELLTRLDLRVPVAQVEFEYRSGNGQNYRTVVRMAQHETDDAAVEILFERLRGLPPRARVHARIPELIPAAAMRVGETFAVTQHDWLGEQASSEEMEVGWHRRDCTWYFPL